MPYYNIHCTYTYLWCNKLATDEVYNHPDQDMNDERKYEDNEEPLSPDKLSQEAIYLVYENFASGTPLLNQAACD